MANNFNNYLIDIGGEIAANGSSKTGLWTIGIQDPQLFQQKVSFTVPNSDNFIGVATSGDYLNFKYIDGQLVSHSIDPRTIKSKDNNILSVTVLDEISVARADAFATAFNVMNLDESIEISESLNLKIKIKPKNIIAVTGTNGKTSIANFYQQILSLNNKKVASIGTLGVLSKKFKLKTNNTSIDPVGVHKILQKLKKLS